VQTAASGSAHQWRRLEAPKALTDDPSGMHFSFCPVDGVELSHVEIRVVDMCDLTQPAAEAVGSEASTILWSLLEKQKGVVKRIESDGDRLLSFLPTGLLEQIIWIIFGLGETGITTRVMEERLADGCRLNLARWNEQENKLFYEAESGLTMMSTMTLTYERKEHTWRLDNDEFLPCPKGLPRKVMGTLAPDSVLSYLGRVCAHHAYKRLQTDLAKTITERAAAAQFVRNALD